MVFVVFSESVLPKGIKPLAVLKMLRLADISPAEACVEKIADVNKAVDKNRPTARFFIQQILLFKLIAPLSIKISLL
ncbi:MAG: hypothetical protein ACFNVI_07450, partial [Lachnoanaerobaculum gingivalis]